MKNFLVLITGYGEGCDYTIGCNKTWVIIEADNKNEKALAYLEQLKKILEYQNRDIFGSTNLNMDPWLE